MGDDVTWPGVVLMALGVLQTCALAYIGTRSKRIRATDRRKPPAK